MLFTDNKITQWEDPRLQNPAITGPVSTVEGFAVTRCLLWAGGSIQLRSFCPRDRPGSGASAFTLISNCQNTKRDLNLLMPFYGTLSDQTSNPEMFPGAKNTFLFGVNPQGLYSVLILIIPKIRYYMACSLFHIETRGWHQYIPNVYVCMC